MHEHIFLTRSSYEYDGWFLFSSVDLLFQLSLQFDHCMDPSYKTPTCLRASPSYTPGKLRRKPELKIRWYRRLLSGVYFRIRRHLTRGDCEALQSKSRYRLGICNWNLLACSILSSFCEPATKNHNSASIRLSAIWLWIWTQCDAMFPSFSPVKGLRKLFSDFASFFGRRA